MCNVVYVQCNYIGVLVFADMALLREPWGYTYHCFMCVRHVSSSLCGCAHRVFATLYTPLTSILWALGVYAKRVMYTFKRGTYTLKKAIYALKGALYTGGIRPYMYASSI